MELHSYLYANQFQDSFLAKKHEYFDPGSHSLDLRDILDLMNG